MHIGRARGETGALDEHRPHAGQALKGRLSRGAEADRRSIRERGVSPGPSKRRRFVSLPRAEPMRRKIVDGSSGRSAKPQERCARSRASALAFGGASGGAATSACHRVVRTLHSCGVGASRGGVGGGQRFGGGRRCFRGIGARSSVWILSWGLASSCDGLRPDPGGPSSARSAAHASTQGGSDGASARDRIDAREDTRFIRIRNLLSLDPEAPERATKLYPLVAPICSDERERREFIEVARWSASFSIGQDTLPTVLALDTIEHVATSCFRSAPEAAFDLLRRAKEAVPDPYRIEILTARLRASRGEFDAALEQARAAAAAGSVHALALLANIQAEVARDKSVAYSAGMLDEAIRTVSVEPNANWSLIDLTAVLSTRAHLLSERAAWEPKPASLETLRLATETYKRLALAPFIETTRTLALDHLCFDSVEIGDDAAVVHCRRAALESGNLGAAVVARVDRDPKIVDLARLERLERLADDMKTLPKGSTVMILVRGDESELVSWTRPGGRALAPLARLQGTRIVFVDRTKSTRASGLADHILDLGIVRPAERIRAGADTLAVPCVAAILAGRRTPASCPLERGVQSRLGRLGKIRLAFLIGRDLDAEIDDLRLYEVRTILLSFRQPRIEKGLDVQLKSLSDVWILGPHESTMRR